MLHSSTAAQLVVDEEAACMGITDGGGCWQAEIFVEASSTLSQKEEEGTSGPTMWKGGGYFLSLPLG